MNRAKGVSDFVLHKHTNSDGVHWDLMLSELILSQSNNIESQDDLILATWKFQIPPFTENFRPSLDAIRIFNHRKVYLEYQGLISNNRGRCEIIDRGKYYLITQKTYYRKIYIAGGKVEGLFKLEKLNNIESFIESFKNNSDKGYSEQNAFNQNYWRMTLLSETNNNVASL